MGISVNFPITNPVVIFTMVLFIILLVPMILNRFRIPGIIGLILSGLIFGPNGFYILERDSSIVLFGTVGLLYIMFLAGLEIDMQDFKRNKNRSIVFGILTFIIPMTLGTFAGFYLLDLSWISSVLLASMFASHTLIVYPIITRLGITKNKAVNVAVGGTILTDTAALLVLAIIAASASGAMGEGFIARMALGIPIFAVAVLWGFPFLTRWFFKYLETEGVAQFIFVLALVFLAGFMAELAGIESIIGAFLAGLALNQLIPHTSALMNRLEFVGNALFIPFFLISVGMLVDLRVFFSGWEAFTVALVMSVVAITAKWLAAFFTQKIFKMTLAERGIIFAMSNAQAAATLAAVMVGYRLGLFNDNVLNGTIVMILVTCLVSSFVAEKAGREIVLADQDILPEAPEKSPRILVPLSNPESIESLINLALMIGDEKKTSVTALNIVKDDHEMDVKMAEGQKMLDRSARVAAAVNKQIDVATRVDLNVTGGITRAIKELRATEVLLGWNPKMSFSGRVFWSVLESLLRTTGQMIIVSRIQHPVNTFKRVMVIVPPRAVYEPGCLKWMNTIKRLATQAGTSLVFYTEPDSERRLITMAGLTKPAMKADFRKFDDWDSLYTITSELTTDDLLVVISARKGSISYSGQLDRIPRYLSRYFGEYSYMFIFPDQIEVDPTDLHMQLDGLATSPIQENIDRINELGGFIRRKLGGGKKKVVR